MQKFFLAVLTITFLVSATTEAQSRRRTSDAYASSSYSGGGLAGTNAISGAFGFFASGGGNYVSRANNTDQNPSPHLSGLFGLGGDFEHFLSEDLSVGGIFRYYSTTDSIAGADYTDSLMTIGGIARAHVLNTNTWTGSVTTGLGILSPSAKRGTVTHDINMGFGFYLGLGLMYKVDETLAFGIENMRALGLGEKHNGWVLDDFMGKVRFAL